MRWALLARCPSRREADVVAQLRPLSWIVVVQAAESASVNQSHSRPTVHDVINTSTAYDDIPTSQRSCNSLGLQYHLYDEKQTNNEHVRRVDGGLITDTVNDSL